MYIILYVCSVVCIVQLLELQASGMSIVVVVKIKIIELQKRIINCNLFHVRW